MLSRFLDRTVLFSIIIMLITCLGLSSCETLRKKFTRKKKVSANQSLESQPVLEPQEYLAPDEDVKKIYKQHYGLIKVWYKDLWTGVTQRDSDSIVKYAINQILDHIQDMKSLLKDEKAQELNQLADLLTFYRFSLEQGRQVRNYSRIQSDLRAFHRMLRVKFRDDVVANDLVKP